MRWRAKGSETCTITLIRKLNLSRQNEKKNENDSANGCICPQSTLRYATGLPLKRQRQRQQQPSSPASSSSPSCPSCPSSAHVSRGHPPHRRHRHRRPGPAANQRRCRSKKFFRADHFRQHLKYSHASKSGMWMKTLENKCLMELNLIRK